MLRRFLKGRRLASPNRYCSTKANIVSINRLNLNGFAFKIERYNIRSTHILILMQTVFTALIGNASEAQIARLSQCWATPPRAISLCREKGQLQGMVDRGRIAVFIPLCRKYGRGLQAKRKIYGPKAIAFGPILFKNILQFQFRFDCV